MAYSELVKNFERIRDYMREFYVYGFKSRDEYGKKSVRTYDDERRRIESWLADYMGFVRTREGKNIFISIDSRFVTHNPLYNAWKAASFTQKDITLHFIIFDILSTADVCFTLGEITDKIENEYLSRFEKPLEFDESTVRKKLGEYEKQGLVLKTKQGRRVLYQRAADVHTGDIHDVLDYFSEVFPCGVIGSFLLDKEEHCRDRNLFAFKHHYITGALDSGILYSLLSAIGEGKTVHITKKTRRSREVSTTEYLPICIFASVQNGRQYLMAHNRKTDSFDSVRLDYIEKLSEGSEARDFCEKAERFNEMRAHMWGVVCKNRQSLERVEFGVRVLPGEEHIIWRLHREKRCGTVENIGENEYRFSAQVYDINEMIPWIRTFICRITYVDFSNKVLERRFLSDIEEMYRMYFSEVSENDVQ